MTTFKPHTVTISLLDGWARVHIAGVVVDRDGITEAQAAPVGIPVARLSDVGTWLAGNLEDVVAQATASLAEAEPAKPHRAQRRAAPKD